MALLAKTSTEAGSIKRLPNGFLGFPSALSGLLGVQKDFAAPFGVGSGRLDGGQRA
jgi:hypothetical protein